MNWRFEVAFCHTSFVQDPRTIDAERRKEANDVRRDLKLVHYFWIPVHAVFNTLVSLFVGRPEGLEHSGAYAAKQLAERLSDFRIAGIYLTNTSAFGEVADGGF